MSTPSSKHANTNVGVGMSRAAQKKRKRLSLSNSTTPISSKKALVQSTNSKKKSAIISEKKSEKLKSTDSKDSIVCAQNLNDLVDATCDVVGTIQDILEFQEVLDITSENRAKHLMQRLFQPTNLGSFYFNHWQKSPLVINRNDISYWNKLLTLKQICNTLKKQLLIIDRDVILIPSSSTNVTTNSNHLPGKEITVSALIALCTQSSSSILILNAVKHFDILWKLCSALEHEFSSIVGCRILLSYPSPNKSTSHYEVVTSEVDSFLLQLEGASNWVLCHVDSNEMHFTMQPGDSLYVPQGWTYRMNSCKVVPCEEKDMEASPEENIAITLHLFTNQFNSMADVLNLLLPQVHYCPCI